jgi:hypothetical protein
VKFFHHSQTGQHPQPYQQNTQWRIVITDVGRDFALGYLLLPKSIQERAQAGVAEQGTIAASRSAN